MNVLEREIQIIIENEIQIQQNKKVQFPFSTY